MTSPREPLDDGGPVQLGNGPAYEPAFPRPVAPMLDGGVAYGEAGMSLRDYFAAAALASGQCPHNVYEYEKRAEWCAKQASAMLEQRNKP